MIDPLDHQNGDDPSTLPQQLSLYMRRRSCVYSPHPFPAIPHLWGVAHLWSINTTDTVTGIDAGNLMSRIKEVEQSSQK
jgi:hypothetical protein